MVARANANALLDANNYPIFDSVVQIVNSTSYGSGSRLKNTDFILTSAHVAINSTSETKILFSKANESQELQASEIFLHPLYQSDGSTPEYDLALIRLNGSPPSWAPGYEIQTSPYIYGVTVWIAGYGYQSLGGQESYFPGLLKKSWGANVTDFPTTESGNITPSSWDEAYLAFDNTGLSYAINKSDSVVVIDFDDGTEGKNALKFDGITRAGEYGLENEAIPQPGDSGGPILNSGTGQILGVVTAGYTTYSDPDWSRFGNFGELSVNASPRHFSGWIEAITNGWVSQITSSSEKTVYYDPNYNFFLGSGGSSQTFKITLTDYESSHIFAANAQALFIDSAEKWIVVENFGKVRVKLGEYGFGSDITINPDTLSLVVSDAPKTSLPARFDSTYMGTDRSDDFLDELGISQKVSGGNGLDTYTVAGRWFTDYDIETSGSSVILRNFDNEEVDFLSDIERIRFSENIVVGFDIDGNSGQAFRIYKAAFDRDPTKYDLGGLGYWVKQMDNGMDLIEVAARFIDSDEFRSLYGVNPSNGTFLIKVYSNVLGRNPDAEGYAWWVDQLANNPEKTKQKVLSDFSESSENQENVAELIANGITFDFT